MLYLWTMHLFRYIWFIYLCSYIIHSWSWNLAPIPPEHSYRLPAWWDLWKNSNWYIHLEYNINTVYKHFLRDIFTKFHYFSYISEHFLNVNKTLKLWHICSFLHGAFVLHAYLFVFLLAFLYPITGLIPQNAIMCYSLLIASPAASCSSRYSDHPNAIPGLTDPHSILLIPSSS